MPPPLAAEETSPARTILIVDDAPANLTVLSEILAPHFRVLAATSGPAALQIAARDPPPDLILLDVMMPGMDGFAVIAALQGNPATRGIPVIFVTALDAEADEARGLGLGAVDYITKPVQPALVLARVRTHIELKLARDRLADQNAFLEAELARRMQELLLVQDVTIRALARLAEVRDEETGSHVRRTQLYVRLLAERLRAHPRFAAVLTPAGIEKIVKSAPLHDIGKVGIPDSILRKGGRLTAEEWAIMKTHTTLGSDAIEAAERDAERPVEFLSTAKEIAHWHHEKWDGSGYPDALAGEAIPISARLMALADMFDALVSRRAYKPAMPIAEVAARIAAESGRHFDPDVVDAFLAEQDRFAELAARHAEP